ncbi:hypothetical protein Bpfe_008102 [Biomphalaria pfeifferi]|uniref:Uncharacterized protein n=1 Tax=Biomphalaria pfeifferi TaxID=112525 RepID=A0AAD8BXF4_BIOPF|nr:hypothetical protein Bpfe_008102 [Biomphalaria pfeifferi]
MFIYLFFFIWLMVRVERNLEKRVCVLEHFRLIEVADNKNSTCIAMAQYLDERVIGLPGGELAGTDLLEEPD